ncbi:MAG: primosomal protein N' [Alphaproteobacteria bacterium]|nr:primosomal protein N' [Alphaproteobacteria bacterium]
MKSNPFPVNPPVKLSVLLPLPLNGAFDYEHSHLLPPGTLVKVSFGSRVRYGITWEGEGKPSTVPKTLKPIITAFEGVQLPEASLKFLTWVSDYTMSARGQILKMILPTPEAFEACGEQLYGIAKLPQRMTAQRQKILDFLHLNPEPLSISELVEKSGVSKGIINSLVKEEVLSLQGVRPWAAPHEMLQTEPEKPQLSSDQLVAAEEIKKSLDSHQFHTFLLEGITGSGKTEVYFEAIDHVLQKGGQSLVLLPEISLSTQWLQRFKKRFGFQPALWHSDLGKSERKATFRTIMEGGIPIIVGARSALFLPFPDLKLIIVDEEHDGSYKQEEGVIYNGRDMAVVRARLSGATSVLASATPSLETELNVQSKKYGHLQLNSRYGGAELPEVKLIDLRKVKRNGSEWISPALRGALQQTMERGEQAMLFLNRRGYAPMTLCRSCGDRIMCPYCSVSLVQHKHQSKLLCHHCGHVSRLPSTCPSCQEEETYCAIGPGVERIYEEVKTFLPHHRCALLTSDHLTSSQKIAEQIQRIQNHEVDVLIGTQMMAKGHHFPLLTLVGIVDGDSALSGSDLRASEKSFQLLHQVAGRSGREQRRGQVLLQTHQPEHPVMQALVGHDKAQFAALEAEQRMMHGFPPFGRLAALILSGRKEDEVQKAARALARTFPVTDKAELLGPTPAPLVYLRGKHRWRLLVKTAKDFAPQPLLKMWLAHTPLPPSVQIQIDIDPYSFF